MSNGKLKSRPPANNDLSLDDFLEAADTQTKEAGRERSDRLGASKGEDEPVEPGLKSRQPSLEPYPWETPGVREDLAKIFNLRLPEPYFLKLKYIAEKSPDSMQKFCLSILLPAIDEKVDELTKP